MSYEFESGDENLATRKSFTCNFLCLRCAANTVGGHRCRRSTCKYLPIHLFQKPGLGFSQQEQSQAELNSHIMERH